MKGSFSLDSLVGVPPCGGVQELGWEGGGGRGEDGGRTVPRRLPLSLTMSTLHEEQAARQVVRPPLGSIREQEGPVVAAITKSNTSDSLVEQPQSKDASPSMMSSGYESQTISSSTISSEESLSPTEELEGVVRRAGRVGRSEHRLSCPPGVLRRPH